MSFIAFTARHWVTGIIGFQPCSPPTGCTRGDTEPREIAAMGVIAGEQRLLAFDGDGMGDQPSTGSKRAPGGVDHVGAAGSPADKDRIGRRKIVQRLRCRAFYELQVRGSERRAFSRIIAARVASRSIATAFKPRSWRSHSMAMERTPRRYPRASSPLSGPSADAPPRGSRAWSIGRHAERPRPAGRNRDAGSSHAARRCNRWRWC